MSIFYDNLTKFEDGADKLEEKRALQHSMSEITKDIKEQYKQVEPREVNRMKNFMYYYGKDWSDEGPLTPEEDADTKCKLASTFRQMKDAIETLREFGKLDMLKPIISDLKNYGISLSVDKYDNFYHVDSYLDSMVKLHASVKDINDEYKDKIKADAVANLVATEKGYDTIAKSILKSRSGKKQNIDKCSETLQDIVADNLLDNNVMTDCINYIRESVK